HPENVARQQIAEIPKANETRLRLVQHRQVDRVESRIYDKAGNDRDQRQAHQKRDGRALSEKFAKPAARGGLNALALQAGNPGLNCICHAAASDLLMVAPRRWFTTRVCRPKGPAYEFSTQGRSLRAQRAFKLFLSPLDDVVELFVALRELCHHHGIDGLVVHLGTDFGPRRRAEHRGLLVTPWRIAVHDALWRLDRLPRVKIIHALE